MFKQLDRVVALLEEQNGLLRELLVSQGRMPLTPRSGTEKRPPLGAEAVSRVTREDQIRREREEEAKKAAPWRSGPAPAPTAPHSGDESKHPTGF